MSQTYRYIYIMKCCIALMWLKSSAKINFVFSPTVLSIFVSQNKETCLLFT